MQIRPKSGFAGLLQNWQSDLIAAISVSLVALPLGLGIALACDLPPMAGIISAVVGGLVTTFVRSSHIAINGPTAGLIAVILTSKAALDDGSGRAINYVLAVFVVAGAVQLILGLLRLGRYADVFHSTVIRGILAAIGIIIIAKQIHIALGTSSDSDTIFGNLADVIYQLPNINPFVAIISVLGMLLLIYHSRISYRFFHFLPAPMWVLVLSIPFVYAFNFFEPHDIPLLGSIYSVGPELLIDIPDKVVDSLIFPDFGMIHTIPFWSSVLAVTMIASIESLASNQAIDKLDPYKRKTNLNRDLSAIGISTMVSGFLGGLPVITVIVRSTVNIHNHAKTKWSNLYHGLLILVFIFVLTPVIQKVPLAALAVLLVFIGFRLASVKVVKEIDKTGVEQLFFFFGTLILTLTTNLMIGLFGGLLLVLTVQLLLANVPVRTFFRLIMRSGSYIYKTPEGMYDVKIKGIANFLATITIERMLHTVPSGSEVTINLSAARLVDHSILEILYDFKHMQEVNGGHVTIEGLEKHNASSNHKMAMQVITAPRVHTTLREQQLQKLAFEKHLDFVPAPREDIDYFQTFYFFQSRSIEYKSNFISGEDHGIFWEITDITFDEGGFFASEEYSTTLALIELPYRIPEFTIEKKQFLERVLHIPDHKDIDFRNYHNFSDEYQVKVSDRREMDEFLTSDLKSLLEKSGIHHIESNGESLLIFNDTMRLASLSEYARIIDLMVALREELHHKEDEQKIPLR